MVGSILTAERHHAYREGVAESEHLEREIPGTESEYFAIEAVELRALLAVLEGRDGYTGEHSKTVMGLAVELARRMGLSDEELRVVGDAALLHDIGKASTPDPILKKQGPLDEQEREVMQEHVEVGARMVASVKALAHLAPLVRATHERWDGKGYPDGLEGEEIPLASRIVYVCDAWDAMTSNRPYREALDVETRIREFQNNVGRQFDPRVVFALVEVLKTRYLLPTDEAERMISEALHLAQNRADGVRHRVQRHYQTLDGKLVSGTS
jgi:putative nucleotidyltransferase with HDIG domain